MRIDLHTHSLVSDGTQTPTELVRAAVGAGLDVLAITDHDTAESWTEAEAAAREVGIGLVLGVEISTKHRGQSVHLLAYLPDPTEPALAESLALIVEGRTDRAPGMVAALREHGSAITLEAVRRKSGSGVTGRPHVADVLVELGEVRNRDEAFARLLSPGMPGYVTRYAPALVDSIGIVAGAGGASVVAHPWGRNGSDLLDDATFADLAARGLAGIEVDHADHSPEKRDRLRGIARDLDLVVTGSSDHHGLGKSLDFFLGANTTAPEEYERLLARSSLSSERSGRRTPEVVGGALPFGH
ncbi:MAG: PHP domain-containing protein [Nocardioides sp.]